MKDRKKQFFHLRDSIESARQILELINKQELDKEELVTAFKNGLSGSKLVIKFKLVAKLGKSKDSAKQGILVALKGYDGNTYGMGDSFDGLIPREEYNRIAEGHVEKSRRDVGFSNLKRKVGIHAQTDIERIDTVKSALRARGVTPDENMVLLSDLDRLIIECCMNHPYLRANQFGGHKRVTQHLNSVVPNRTIKLGAVKAVMIKIRKKESPKNAA